MASINPTALSLSEAKLALGQRLHFLRP
ncbi:hypothetical protein ERY430_60398 [Erythrobacter sp. EC-HK427]|nr:hypothetical protein ERY430_60398 [Erythrobacter sp. EC-HK427]